MNAENTCGIKATANAVCVQLLLSHELRALKSINICSYSHICSFPLCSAPVKYTIQPQISELMGGWISVTQATAWISERSENSFYSQTSRLPTHSIVLHSSRLNVLYIEHWSTQAVLRLTQLYCLYSRFSNRHLLLLSSKMDLHLAKTYI